MPNKRRAGQVFIGLQIDSLLGAEMDRARGLKDRSQFVREAIAEKLKKMGVSVPERSLHAPPRAHVIQVHHGTGNNYSLNEEASSKYGSKKKKGR